MSSRERRKGGLEREREKGVSFRCVTDNWSIRRLLLLATVKKEPLPILGVCTWRCACVCVCVCVCAQGMD